MKNLTVIHVKNLVKVSTSFAIELVYFDFLNKKKIYLNKGNNAQSTINYLTKHFNANFESGNDAARGGKVGEYKVMIFANEAFDLFKNKLNEANENQGKQQDQNKQEKETAISSMVISEEEKNKFLIRTEGMSNKKTKKVAHNYAAKKLGFYSIGGMEKFNSLYK